jgi:toxin ParE1/3/4
MMLVRFHAEAEAEMIEAAAYYEMQQAKLGKRFLTSVRDAINRIQINPMLFSVVEFEVRRCRIKTFPFDILFQILSDQLVVIAVMHLHRNPDYWKSRRENG